MSGILDQLYPPKPSFTEAELPDQTGKVFLITGGSSGLGLELAKMLYQRNGVVYIATRSLPKIQSAIASLTSNCPSSTGRLEPLVLDLADLTTIRPAAQRFLEGESRLDVLFLNAGVMNSPLDARTVQGLELQMGTNAVGHHLLARCLEGVLRTTAEGERREGREGKVRVVWLASMVAVGTPRGGVVFEDGEDGVRKPKVLGKSLDNYMQSKAGNVYLAREWGGRLREAGVVGVVVNPGMVRTELQRHNAFMSVMMGIMFKPAKFGAYTQLFAGLSPDVIVEHSGAFIIPWGRFGVLPDHIENEIASASGKGTGVSRQFWDYCEKAIEGF